MCAPASRLTAALVVPLLLVGCSHVELTAPPTSSGSASAPDRTPAMPGARPGDTPSAGAGDSPTPSGGAEAPSTSAGDSLPVPVGSVLRTEVAYTWVDGSWTITESSTDLCPGETPSVSPFSTGKDMFTCGPTAASLLACKDAGGFATCIQNAKDKIGTRFPLGTPFTPTALTGEPNPLEIVLADGHRCVHISHDQEPHYGNRGGFFRCGSDTLFRREDGKGYFDTSRPVWTVERATGTEPPRVERVAKVVYAR